LAADAPAPPARVSSIDEEVVEDVLDSSRAGGMAIRGGVLRTLSYVGAMLLSLA
jgi:hypothetical protein